MKIMYFVLYSSVLLSGVKPASAVEYTADTTLNNQSVSDTELNIATNDGDIATVTANDTTFYISGNTNIGIIGGNGILNLSNSHLTSDNSVSIGLAGTIPSGNATSGTLIVDGSSTVDAAVLNIGQGVGSGAGSSGVVDIAQGGVIRLGGINGATALTMGTDGGVGTLNVNGTLNMSVAPIILLGTEQTSGEGTGQATININSGGIFATSATVILAESNTQFNLNGGSLLINKPDSGTLIPGYPDHTIFDFGINVTQSSTINVATGAEFESSGSITGTGGIIKAGNGVLLLSGNSPTYSGPIDVNDGTLDVTGNLPDTEVNVASGAILSGSGQVGDTTLASGGVLTVGSLTATDTDPTNFTTNNLNNNGTLILSRDSQIAGNTLTVLGDYTGNNGRLILNTVLGQDNSLTDKLVIAGDAQGSTDVQVLNLGGMGDKAINGIEIVSVGGTSSGAFHNSQRIRAGLYDYTVVQRGTNYYLTSDYIPTGTSSIGSVSKNVIPSAGGYIANLAAANTLFNIQLADHASSTEYVNPVTGKIDTTSLWLRQEGGHNRFTSGPLKNQANRYVVQLGGDLMSGSFTGEDRWNVGVMTGYANQHGHSTSRLSGYNAKSQVYGYSGGAYGTWYQNGLNKPGAYIDSWLQYNWFTGQVSDSYGSDDSYRSKGVVASVESGYTVKVNESKDGAFFVQPQAQLIFMDVRSDSLRDITGSQVSGEGEGNLQSRLGVKAYFEGHSRLDNDTHRLFKPYVGLNWLHNTQRYGVKMDDASLYQEGAKSIVETQVGVEGRITTNLTLWGSASVQVGDSSYSDTSAQLGIKYIFH